MGKAWHIRFAGVLALLCAFMTARGDTAGVYLTFGDGKVIENKGDTLLSECFALTDTFRLDTPEDADFELKIWAENLHGTEGKKYEYRDAGGKRKRVSSPEWGVKIGDSISVLFSNKHEENPFGEAKISVRARILYNGTQVAEGEVDTSLKEIYSNALQILTRKGAEWTFSIGRGECGKTFHFEIPEGGDGCADTATCSDGADRVGVVVAPGGGVRLAALSARKRIRPRVESVDPDELKADAAGAFSPIAGEWEVYDYELDPELLKLGQLRLLIVPEGEKNYTIYYLSGYYDGKGWRSGMRKGTLTSTSFPDTYDVEWTDADFLVMRKGIKASYSGDGILKIHFPAQGSYIRLRRLDWN